MLLRASSSLFFLWALLSFEATLADTNVTVDDSDSSIKYSDDWSVTSASNSLDYGGFHHLSSTKTSTANFTFTGTAVYIMAPLWPYAVGANAAVDNSSPVSVNMENPSVTSTDGGSEDVASAVLWGATGLSNSSHTLHISFWDNADFLALDAIVYVYSAFKCMWQR
ncbi:hypothetical protein BT96DRAFT_813993 [Gymnopus androsaceus JB14]|uniref:Uncharacterized protein n=1 Tax=Gymnopus androsaceus JB14 TaxID=1447944 RepID=A0A6A4I441_9AGAR|nr:hypothetical protein BT96DRAFT_813993 [Gymnopus androsaceus JB14]